MVRPYTQAKAPVQRQPLRVRVKAHVGQPLLLEWELINHQRVPLSVQVRSPEALVAAQNRVLTSDFVRDQLGRLGGSAYILTEVELDLAGQPFIPSSLLNAMRREAVEQLSALQSRPPTRMIADPIATLDHALAQITPSVVAHVRPALHLLVRTPDQLTAAIALRPASITLDYLELYGLKPAVEQVQAAGIEARVASPRILKPSEQRIVRFLLKLDCPILVRSAGLLQALLHEQAPVLIGDFSLNAANLLSAQTLLGMGLNRLTPTHDLNAAQITELAQGMGSERIEVIAYQHLPVFHTEHCVFCRFLSKGTSYKDCGHPCEQHRVALRDHQGREHPVMADVGCRNTVFGAEAQEGSAHLDAWQAAGIQHYRLEFVHEDGEQVGRVAQAFRSTLDRQITSSELGRRLHQIAPQGTTQGSLFVPLIS
jgi:putative protease